MRTLVLFLTLLVLPARAHSEPAHPRLRKIGIALAVVGAVVTAAGLALIIASAEGHSPLGGCSDCKPAGIALGVYAGAAGFTLGMSGAVMWSLTRDPPPPRALTMGWTWRF